MDWLQVLQSFGYPIMCALACGWFIYKLVVRDKNEAHEREEKLQQNISDNAVALSKVADTIAESNKTNRELSETNRLLVDKMEEKLTGIDVKVDKILDEMKK